MALSRLNKIEKRLIAVGAAIAVGRKPFNTLGLSLIVILLFQFGHISSVWASDKDVDKFVSYEQPPTPIGGVDAIKKYLKYPEIAKKNHFEGSVLVGVLIDDKGNPVKTEIRHRKGFKGFARAAIEAVMAVKWQPAKQGDRSVAVWVWVPIHFNCISRGMALN